MPNSKQEDSAVSKNSITASIKYKNVKSAEANGSNQMLREHEEIEKNEGDKNDKNSFSRKKTKSRKTKTGEVEKKNISMKSSFTKFDVLQKRSLIHNHQGETQKNCTLCHKAVYKMEEVKAENNIYHGNCFRCNKCNKQLKVDTYQSHEGVLYCTVHFKMLFLPKSVEQEDTVQLRKPELIICENQPTELPPDVVRASDKPDLGLEQLHQLNVRSRFQAFEHGQLNKSDTELDAQRNYSNIISPSPNILSKVAKLQHFSSSANSEEYVDDSDENDIYFISDNNEVESRQKKKRNHIPEHPVGIGEAVNDIRTLFETGHGIKKEERREERKQEIQNIRSRLFLGKQARIKEMYQQAVAESGNVNDKKSNIHIEVDSKSIRERFENGEVFTESQSGNKSDGENFRNPVIEKETDVFESAISKKSRSIFMELDANVVAGARQNILPFCYDDNKVMQHQKFVGSITQLKSEPDNDVVRCGESVEDVKIKTSEISEKFKFFEKYNRTETEKRVFRITPPREGVVKMPSHEETEDDVNLKHNMSDINTLAHSRTTSMMLNKFRAFERNLNTCDNKGVKPLKSFTPPPDGEPRLCLEQDSDEYDSNDDEEEGEKIINFEEYANDSYGYSHFPKDDEALKEAQNSARAKQLRIKFEKWHTNEIKREEIDKVHINRYVTDENSIESTQSIRERFEQMRSVKKLPQSTHPRHPVNRFV